MADKLIGISVQTLIWMCMVYLYFKIGSFNEIPNIIILVSLIIALFVYFFEFLFNSKTFSILSQKKKPVKGIKEIVSKLSSSKPYVEIYAKAFNYKDEKEVISYEKFFLYEFRSVSDSSQTSYLELFLHDNKVNSKLIILDLNVNVKFHNQISLEELNKSVNKIKNETSMLDKYYLVKTQYILKGLKKTENLFVIENSLLFNPYVFVFFYFLLIGEFYKMIVEKNMIRICYDLHKQVNKSNKEDSKNQLIEVRDNQIQSQNNLLTQGKFRNYESFFDDEDENKELLNHFSYKSTDNGYSGYNGYNESPTPKYENTDGEKSVDKSNIVIQLSNDYLDVRDLDTQVGQEYKPLTIELPKKAVIDNYDPIFDALPINSLQSSGKMSIGKININSLNMKGNINTGSNSERKSNNKSLNNNIKSNINTNTNANTNTNTSLEGKELKSGYFISLKDTYTPPKKIAKSMHQSNWSIADANKTITNSMNNLNNDDIDFSIKSKNIQSKSESKIESLKERQSYPTRESTLSVDFRMRANSSLENTNTDPIEGEDDDSDDYSNVPATNIGEIFDNQNLKIRKKIKRPKTLKERDSTIMTSYSKGSLSARKSQK